MSRFMCISYIAKPDLAKQRGHISWAQSYATMDMIHWHSFVLFSFFLEDYDNFSELVEGIKNEIESSLEDDVKIA